jgi:hypothetical protein
VNSFAKRLIHPLFILRILRNTFFRPLQRRWPRHHVAPVSICECARRKMQTGALGSLVSSGASHSSSHCRHTSRPDNRIPITGRIDQGGKPNVV